MSRRHLTRRRLLLYCAISLVLWWGVWEAGRALAHVSIWDFVR